MATEIKANELRIGNWVRWIDIAYMGVGEFQFGTVNLTHDWSYVDFVEPIPLTEEWLLKFGAKMGRSGASWRTAYIQLPGLGDMNFEIYNDGRIFITIETDITNLHLGNIHHVHTLQNLFFALCGAELTEDKQP